MTKRKLKPMVTNIDTARKLAEVFGDIIYNDLVIVDSKIFVSTAEEVKKQDDK